jgi:hypothetical protein
MAKILTGGVGKAEVAQTCQAQVNPVRGGASRTGRRPISASPVRG